MSIPEGVLRQAVLLSERYITDRFLPDKAIDLIDEACSDLNLKDPDHQPADGAGARAGKSDLRAGDMSAEAPEGAEFTEQAGLRYARIAELRSQEILQRDGAEQSCF